jgi:hypothetical protein
MLAIYTRTSTHGHLRLQDMHLRREYVVTTYHEEVLFVKIFVNGSQRPLQGQFLGIKYINERGELANTRSSTGSFSLISGFKFEV